MLTRMNPDARFDQELFRLERRIAKRADQLARDKGVDRGHALDHWRQAEREVWESRSAELAAVEFGAPDAMAEA